MSRAWYSTHFGLRTEEADNALRSFKKSKSVDASVCDGNVREGLAAGNQTEIWKDHANIKTNLDGFQVGGHLDRRMERTEERELADVDDAAQLHSRESRSHQPRCFI